MAHEINIRDQGRKWIREDMALGRSAPEQLESGSSEDNLLNTCQFPELHWAASLGVKTFQQMTTIHRIFWSCVEWWVKFVFILAWWKNSMILQMLGEVLFMLRFVSAVEAWRIAANVYQYTSCRTLHHWGKVLMLTLNLLTKCAHENTQHNIWHAGISWDFPEPSRVSPAYPGATLLLGTPLF